ncbi:GlxA family transcriptional regulator [Aestuariispira insulae]|uniref:AraC family transcriptional regulator with amidase-like domain n=1 Tax=Aestuariispira insulae TaxID=1461337 RepID=A0A3D9HMW5_9PROT|nr:GlxA family transcriptional regulator [Aestuariispira insulae]RED50834.1 AraC family transcriptional regulator with amidase-like domain [Aestuariispira insulae]
MTSQIDQTARIGFLMTPKCSMMAFASAIEPLRAANRLSGKELYDWVLITSDGAPVSASNRIEIVPNCSIDNAPDLNMVFIVAGIDYETYDDQHVFAWLRRLDRHGTPIGTFSSASYIAAKAGLLEGYRCTIHWEDAIGFRETYPHIELTGSMFEIDRNRYTSAGGTSAMDLMLHIIARDHGSELASDISMQFQHDRIRDQADQQRMSRKLLLATKSEKLLTAINLMESNLETPISPAEIAETVGLSVRQMERLFQQHIGQPPARFYMELRLEHARLLLVQTGLPIVEVAVASGFVSHSHFAKCYRQHFNRSPMEERRRKL